MRLSPRPPPSTISPHREVRRNAALLVVVALFAAIFAASLHDADALDAARLLFVLPIALAALGFGARGGLLAGIVAGALVTAWNAISGADMGPLGIASWVLVFLLVGSVLGWLIDSQRRLETRIKRYSELSLDLFCTAGFNGYFEWVNPAWAEVLGYSGTELLSRPFLEFVHPDDRESTQAEVVKLTESGTDTHNFRNRYRAADGSYRWLEWNTRVVSEERRLYATARDVTSLKQAEEVLDDQAARLESMVNERTKALEDSRLETLQRLALAAEYRDDDTHEHTERVGRNSALIARQLGLSEENAALIRRAAPLHDIGKIGIPDAILLKPGELTPQELRQMQEHTTIGAKILTHPRFAILQMARSIALAHHERWDGGGYPRGLRGKEIPLSGRIVAVADVFDALTHERPYKAAWPVEEAVAEIERLAGRRFDPRVVRAFAGLDHHSLLEPVERYDLDLPPPPLAAPAGAPALL
jgi:PAS domain S-box-containing protein/putative nucleotidyltransferase with HDIG domain